MTRVQPCFIVLEGIDASGTTTQCQRLVEHLQNDLRQKAILTHEPSPGPVGMVIRLALTGRLLGPSADFNGEPGKRRSNGGPLDARTLALLYAADRHDHLHTTIETNLTQGRHVVCDRYVMSSLAYQGGFLEDIDWVLELNRHTRRPDVTIYLDLDPDEARKRMRREHRRPDLFEDVEKQRRVRDAYLNLISQYGAHLGRIESVDASGSRTLVEKNIKAVVDRLLSSRGGIKPTSEGTLFDIA